MTTGALHRCTYVCVGCLVCNVSIRLHSWLILLFPFLSHNFQYAILCNQYHAAERLLKAGADVHTKDADGHTAMYYALRDNLEPRMIDLLHEYGAVKDKKKNKEWKAAQELFDRVQATDAKTAATRQQQQQEKAQAAQAEMANNLNLMQQRGQKIEELDDKARHLNEEAQDFANMAKQLKEKTKQGARGTRWLPF